MQMTAFRRNHVTGPGPPRNARRSFPIRLNGRRLVPGPGSYIGVPGLNDSAAPLFPSIYFGPSAGHEIVANIALLHSDYRRIERLVFGSRATVRFSRKMSERGSI